MPVYAVSMRSQFTGINSSGNVRHRLCNFCVNRFWGASVGDF